MKLHQLPSITHKKAKRVGRGRGSGKGRYSTRGVKGQTKRSKVGRAQLSLVVRQLPLLRGRGFKGSRRYPVVVDLEDLNRFRKGTTVTVERLHKEGLIPKKVPYGVKILGSGEMKKMLKFSTELKFSSGARKAIESSGGEIL